jgi:AcrR family transcriptional regulator
VLEQPTVDRRQLRHEATKAEILDAAWEIVRTEGLAALSLRDVATRVGMRAPSLYSYFESKHAIYDAMFGQAWQTYLDGVRDLVPTNDPRGFLLQAARGFIGFAVADPARHQLMNQRVIPGFEPSPESYAPAVEVFETFRERLAALGIDDPKAIDIWTALMAGVVNQQLANDPGGDRWTRLIDDVVDMYLAHVKPRRRRK